MSPHKMDRAPFLFLFLFFEKGKYQLGAVGRVLVVAASYWVNQGLSTIVFAHLLHSPLNAKLPTRQLQRLAIIRHQVHLAQINIIKGPNLIMHISNASLTAGGTSAPE